MRSSSLGHSWPIQGLVTVPFDENCCVHCDLSKEELKASGARVAATGGMVGDKNWINRQSFWFGRRC